VGRRARTAGTTGATGGSTGTTGGSTSTGGTSSTDVTVNLDQTKQAMDGFGINDTWAPAMSDADADALFDLTRGLGLSILRVGMGPDGEPLSDNIYSDIAKASARASRPSSGRSGARLTTAWS